VSGLSGLWKGVSLNSGMRDVVIFQTLVKMAESVFRPLESGEPEFWYLGGLYLSSKLWLGWVSRYSGLWKGVSMNFSIWVL
jgi:hypothetical protein